MNLSDWKSSTNAGLLATRVLDLQIVDRRLDDYLKSKSDINLLMRLELALQAWRNADVGGRATQFRRQADDLADWIRGERRNAAAAMDAFQATRTHYVHNSPESRVKKSDNKKIFRFEDNRDAAEHIAKAMASAERHARANRAFDVAKQFGQRDRHSPTAQIMLRKLRAGNCSEMSRFSCDFLLGRNDSPPVAQFGFVWEGGESTARIARSRLVSQAAIKFGSSVPCES